MSNFKVTLAAVIAVVLSTAAAGAQTVTRPIPDITDCSKPSAADSFFCDSPTLRAAEAAVARLALSARNAGPMWWSVIDPHESWKIARRGPQNSFEDRLAVYATQAQRLDEITRGTKALLSNTFSREALRQDCVVLPNLSFVTFVRSCQVKEVVGVAPGLIAQRQIWNGAGGPDAMDSYLRFSSAVLILEYDGTEADGGSSADDAGWKPVAWADELEGELGVPVLSESKHGTFITVPRIGGGSGAESKDVVVRQADRHRWIEVDAASWRTEVERRIPRPLIALGNAPLDLANLAAELNLLRPNDPRCCPTGGKAEVRLALRDDVLVVDGITFRQGTRPSSPAASSRPGAIRR